MLPRIFCLILGLQIILKLCSLFRKKIFSGQVCYEADLNQFKNKIDWKRALKEGFSFIIDTNDEYDVKNLFQRKSPRSEI